MTNCFEPGALVFGIPLGYVCPSVLCGCNLLGSFGPLLGRLSPAAMLLGSLLLGRLSPAAMLLGSLLLGRLSPGDAARQPAARPPQPSAMLLGSLLLGRLSPAMLLGSLLLGRLSPAMLLGSLLLGRLSPAMLLGSLLLGRLSPAMLLGSLLLGRLSPAMLLGGMALRDAQGLLCDGKFLRLIRKSLIDRAPLHFQLVGIAKYCSRLREKAINGHEVVSYFV